MATVGADSPVSVARHKPSGRQLVRLLTTTDHKTIGKLYLVTSFTWSLLGGILALLIRSELAFPGQQVVSDETYNQLFSMHGAIMLLLSATLLFVGFHTTFLIQHWLGVEGMQRRIADYLPQDGFSLMNQVSTVGAFLLSLSMVPWFYNLYITRKAPKVEVDAPWGWGRPPEWATSCPPPRHNLHTLPRTRSESPAFDLHHPEIAAIDIVGTVRGGPVPSHPEGDGGSSSPSGRSG